MFATVCISELDLTRERMEKHEWWVSWGGLVPLQHQQFCPVSSTSQPESDIWGISRRKGLKKFTISDMI